MTPIIAPNKLRKTAALKQLDSSSFPLFWFHGPGPSSHQHSNRLLAGLSGRFAGLQLEGLFDQGLLAKESWGIFGLSILMRLQELFVIESYIHDIRKPGLPPAQPTGQPTGQPNRSKVRSLSLGRFEFSTSEQVVGSAAKHAGACGLPNLILPMLWEGGAGLRILHSASPWAACRVFGIAVPAALVSLPT